MSSRKLGPKLTRSQNTYLCNIYTHAQDGKNFREFSLKIKTYFRSTLFYFVKRIDQKHIFQHHTVVMYANMVKNVFWNSDRWHQKYFYDTDSVSKQKCNKRCQEILKYHHQVDWIRISLKTCLERSVPIISKILCLKPMKTLWTFSCIVHIHQKYYWNTVQRLTEAIMIWKPFWKPLNLSFDRVCARNLKFLVTTIFCCFLSFSPFGRTGQMY